jgi:hypothetical protein
VSRSDEKRLDDIRDMCAKVASLVERGRAAVEAVGYLGDHTAWAHRNDVAA